MKKVRKRGAHPPVRRKVKTKAILPLALYETAGFGAGPYGFGYPGFYGGYPGFGGFGFGYPGFFW